MSNLSAPPHWTSFVDWNKQCKGITWGNAEKATPAGPDETVKYKSMREFPIAVKYASGVYVKKMYKVDSDRQKKAHEKRIKEMSMKIEKEKRHSKDGVKPTPNKDKFEKIMKKNNIKKSKTRASIIIRAPIPEDMLKFLNGSNLKLQSTNITVSNDLEHKTHVYTGSMADLYQLFQLQKKKVTELLDMKFRFESSNWSVLNELFPYVKPVFKQLLEHEKNELTPGPPHVKLDGGMCHINSIYDVIDIHPPLGTVYVWLTRDDDSHDNNCKNNTDTKHFLVPFDESLIPKPKRKRPKTISDFKVEKPVTFARGCATASLLDARSPIRSFPTHKPVHWRLQEKEREKKRAKTAILTDKEIFKKEKEKKEKLLQKRAKTAAILNRRERKKKKKQEEEKKQMLQEKQIILRQQMEQDLGVGGDNGFEMPEIPTTAATTTTSVSVTPERYHRVHTPIPYPTLEQQRQFLPLTSSPTSLYNLSEGTDYYNTYTNERANLSTAPSFKNQLELVSRRSKRRERKIVEKAERSYRSMTSQQVERRNNLENRYNRTFRVKTLYKIDNVIGDAAVEKQQSPELKWRIDLINQSILSMYYPNAKLSSPPGSPLSASSPETQLAKPPLPHLKLGKLKKKNFSKKGTIVDPVEDARKFVKDVKRKASEKFLKAHPKAKELRKRWKERLKSGKMDFSDEQKAQSLYAEAKHRQKEKAKERLSLIVDHMKDVRNLISREVRAKNKRLRDIARKALFQAQKEKLRRKKEELKRLKAIQDAAFAAAEAKRIKYWVSYVDPQSKLKYWHHKYWGFNKFCEKEPLDIIYFDLSKLSRFQFDLHKYHVLRDSETQRLYIHDVKKKFCRWYEYDDFELYCIIKIQSIIRQYLGASKHDTIKKAKCVTPLQARARGWLLRKKTYDTKVRKALENATISHIKQERSRITSYESLWKVVEEPKPKKKKKFKRKN